MGDDGSLIISTGDGSTWKKPYGGNGPPFHEEYVEQALRDGLIRPDEELGAFRAQYLDNYNGKILRIDASTGEGIPSNPFFDESHPDGARSKVYALGIRNSFRLKIRRGTGSTDPADGRPGVIYAGDVGGVHWEELNIIKQPGQNFGWPLYEGINPANIFYDIETRNPATKNRTTCHPEGLLFRDLIQQYMRDYPHTQFDDPCQEEVALPDDITYAHTTPAMTFGHYAENGGIFVPSYNAFGHPIQKDIDNVDSPVYGSGKGWVGACIIAGGFYSGGTFPEWYQDKFFIADFAEGWIKVIETDLNDDILGISDFFSDTIEINHVEINPHDGALYFIDFRNGIKKITYGQNIKPVAILETDKTYGPSPLVIQLSATKSYDPNKDSITYLWELGNGETSTAPMLSATFTEDNGAPSSHRVYLTVTDGHGLSSRDSSLISVNNTPPQVAIRGLDPSGQYSVEGISFLSLDADVHDIEHPEDELSYQWTLYLGHNTHEHPEPSTHERKADITLLPTDCGPESFYYRIALDVTDIHGLMGSASEKLTPYCDYIFVQLVAFYVNSIDNTTELNWVSIDEKSMVNYKIQRAYGDQKDFITIATVQASNNGNQHSDYQWVDIDQTDGIRKYRLQLINDSGRFAYSQVVELLYLGLETIKIYPNPTSGITTIALGTITKASYLDVYNSTGQLIFHKAIDPSLGNIQEVDLNRLSPGNYYYTLSNGSNSSSGLLQIVK